MNSKMRSSVMGLLLGQFSSPLPEVQKEPVAYLYNGVRLPKLPELPYKYAVIECFEDSDGVMRYGRLICSSEPIYRTLSVLQSGFDILGDVVFFGFVSNEDYWDTYFGIDSALPINEWVKIDENHFDERTFENEFLVADFTWANHDVIYSSDGSVSMSASKPVPIYE